MPRHRTVTLPARAKGAAGIVAILMSVLPRAGVSQQRVPSFSLVAGAGNAFGGFGLRGEVFLAGGRVGVLAGGGILADPGGTGHRAAGAASVRYYVGSPHHRLFADVSWSLVRVYDLLMLGRGPVFDYGPGVSLGYTYAAPFGLTLTAAAGQGYPDHGAAFIAQLGIGWTWRRRAT